MLAIMMLLKKRHRRGFDKRQSRQTRNEYLPLAHAVTRVKGTYILFVTLSFADLPLRTMPSCAVRYMSSGLRSKS